MQIYGLKACDTCRKARKALPQAEFVDVRDEGVPDAVLARALAKFGSTLVNTRSTTWRQLNEAERAAAPLEQIATYPALMKRPLIVDEDAMFLGWSKETQAALNV